MCFSKQIAMNTTRMILEWEDLELYKLWHPTNEPIYVVQGRVLDPQMLTRRYQDHINRVLDVFKKFEETVIMWASSKDVFNCNMWGSYHYIHCCQNLDKPSIPDKRCYILSDD